MDNHAGLTAGQAYLRALQANDVPTIAHLDVTYRCDLDCQHCYLDERVGWPEMTTAEWVHVLDQLQALGTFRLTWSGGDVRQRADFDELLYAAGQRGFVSRVKTHAGRVTAAVADRWAALRVTMVDVSVYSLDGRTHDLFTRREGSHAATMSGIKNMLAAGIGVRISTTVVDINVAEMADMWRYFTGLGCQLKFGCTIFRDNAASTHLDVLNLSPENRQLAEAYRLQTERAEVTALPIMADTPCGAGRSLIYIGPDGAVTPCVVFPMQIGQVREQPLAEIWKTSPQRQALAAWTNKDRTACQSCGGSGLCFYCPGEAYKTTGDFKTAPAHFHARARNAMHGYEAARGPTFSAEQWASVPTGGAHPPRQDKFVFPIYRPQKGHGARVGKPAAPK